MGNSGFKRYKSDDGDGDRKAQISTVPIFWRAEIDHLRRRNRKRQAHFGNSKVGLSFLQNVNQGVLRPEYIEVWGGMDKDKLVRLGKASAPPTENKFAEKGLITLTFPGREVRFVRVKAKNAGILPATHPLIKTAKATLYIDEVTLN